MKKNIYLVIALLFTGLCSLEAQYYSFSATGVCYATADADGNWGEWGEWYDDYSDITIDVDSEEIILYDYDWDIEITYYITDYTEETADESGDLITIFNCIDEDLEAYTIKLMKRLSAEDQRTEVYFYNSTAAEAYTVEESSY